MARLNGWQRLWMVVSVVWVIPVALMFWALGLPPLYTPPTFQQVFVPCPVKTLPADVRDWFVRNASTLKTSDWFVKNDMVPIEVWRLESDGSPPDVCTHNTILTFNPKTKALQLPVFARFGSYGTVLQGYDLDSAIGKELQARIEASQWHRRNQLLLLIGLTGGVPALLYAFGFAIAWIRRGFRQERSPRGDVSV